MSQQLQRSGCGRSIPLVAGLAVLGPAAAAAWAGPVQIVSQERRIVAEVSGAESEVRTAPDAGPFDESVATEVSGEGFRSRAEASMNSTLDEDRFTFAGVLSYVVQDTRGGDDPSPVRAGATISATTVFSLDEPYDYTLRYDLDVEDNDPQAFIEAPFEFMGLDGGSVDEAVVEGETVTGTLRAGDYRLVLPIRIENVVADEQLRSFDVDYSLTLDFEPADGGGGEPNPIPLPPAAWSGLALMGAGLLNRWRKARLA